MREPPKGPIKWARRRVLPWAARLLAWSGVALLLAFGVGRMLTDQYHWSQYLWWMPAEWVIPLAWAVLGASSVLAIGSTRLGGAFVRPFLLVGCLAATLWVGIGEWHLHRFVLPVRPGPGATRAVHWNLSSHAASPIAGVLVVAQDADVVAAVNTPWGEGRAQFRQTVASIAGEHDDGRVRFVERGRLMLASRFPITAYGVARLARLDVPEDWPSSHDPGEIAFVELDTGADAPMVVWIVDVPSDPRLWRARVMREARRAIDEWSGWVWEDVNGRLVRGEDRAAFPEPDLVVGDFNTPRGSASVRALVGELRGGHESAGRGRNASFFLRFKTVDPGYHIDLAFAGEDRRITGYRLERDPGVKHAMQVIDVE